jgi:CTP:molybdopterin cytidylyltransferase MocA
MAQVDRIAGLVPAAGASRRMGRDKRLLPFPGGGTLLEATAALLRAGGVEELIVVLEPGSPCAGLPGLEGARIAVNPDPSRGMLSSIRVGLAALAEEVVAALIQPGDHPFAPPAVVAALRDRYRVERPLLLAPSYSGRRGHPLLLDRALFAEAAACDDAVGLRQLLERRSADLRLLPWDAPDADADLDRPEDLSRLEGLGRRGDR